MKLQLREADKFLSSRWSLFIVIDLFGKEKNAFVCFDFCQCFLLPSG